MRPRADVRSRGPRGTRPRFGVPNAARPPRPGSAGGRTGQRAGSAHAEPGEPEPGTRSPVDARRRLGRSTRVGLLVASRTGRLPVGPGPVAPPTTRPLRRRHGAQARRAPAALDRRTGGIARPPRTPRVVASQRHSNGVARRARTSRAWRRAQGPASLHQCHRALHRVRDLGGLGDGAARSWDSRRAAWARSPRGDTRERQGLRSEGQGIDAPTGLRGLRARLDREPHGRDRSSATDRSRHDRCLGREFIARRSPRRGPHRVRPLRGADRSGTADTSVARSQERRGDRLSHGPDRMAHAASRCADQPDLEGARPRRSRTFGPRRARRFTTRRRRCVDRRRIGSAEFADRARRCVRRAWPRGACDVERDRRGRDRRAHPRQPTGPDARTPVRRDRAGPSIRSTGNRGRDQRGHPREVPTCAPTRVEVGFEPGPTLGGPRSRRPDPCTPARWARPKPPGA